MLPIEIRLGSAPSDVPQERHERPGSGGAIQLSSSLPAPMTSPRGSGSFASPVSPGVPRAARDGGKMPHPSTRFRLTDAAPQAPLLIRRVNCALAVLGTPAQERITGRLPRRVILRKRASRTPYGSAGGSPSRTTYCIITKTRSGQSPLARSTSRARYSSDPRRPPPI